eukprot:999789-Amphidinium_carterae.1
MAHPADDGRSTSSRNVPISVASSSNTSTTSTLPRITGLTSKWRFASADIPQAFLYASID